ncbi:glycosyltransferase family 4 protein [Oceaniferula marina]|nr:glycosyltransferase family 4 protein [Oceaniferula marina]
MDLSSTMRSIKKKVRPDFLSVSLYYWLWQRKASKKIRELCAKQDYDLVHHLTIASFRLPFAVTGHGLPCVVGPVGGCEEFPEALFPNGEFSVRFKESLRNWMTRLHIRAGFGMRRYKEADQVLASTQEMSDVFKKCGVDSIVVPQIGMPTLRCQKWNTQPRKIRKKFRLLFVGGLFYWKGIELALQVMTKLPQYVTLDLLGGGGEQSALAKEVLRLHLEDRVKFLGRKPRKEVLALYEDYDTFLYPSLHDSGAFTVLEAMASGLPIICLDRGGPALSVTNECGKVVVTRGRADTIDGLVTAVKYYLDHPSKVTEHGANGRMRVEEAYNWKQKAKQMTELYSSIINRTT